jgi:hypothetical protein
MPRHREDACAAAANQRRGDPLAPRPRLAEPGTKAEPEYREQQRRIEIEHSFMPRSFGCAMP